MINRKLQCFIIQFYFISWLDFGVFFILIGMFKFFKKVKVCNFQYVGVIVVYCSVGVGCIGIFVVIDVMLDMMYIEWKVDVYGFVSWIWVQCCQMV